MNSTPARTVWLPPKARVTPLPTLQRIAQFFFEHGLLRFNIDVVSARRAHLQISSNLLALAKRK